MSTQRVTIRDVATLAGVHPATVSRALVDATRHQVSKKTLAAVTAAARELGYEPDLTARTLRTGRTTIAGVLVPDLTNPLFPPILRGIEDCLAARDLTALVANTDNDPARERQALRALRGRNVNGFILLTAHRNDDTLKTLLKDKVPVVTVNRVPSAQDASSVRPDDTGGITALVDHLCGLGHSRLAMIAGPRHLSTGFSRLQAFKAALRSHGLEPRPEDVVIARSFSDAEGYRCAAELLSSSTATAVIAANDTLAVGCLDLLRERGFRCPQDLSVTGFNDIRFMDKLSSPLTTVRVPQMEMGVEAARFLVDLITGQTTATRHAVMPVSLVVRASTAPPPKRHRPLLRQSRGQ